PGPRPPGAAPDRPLETRARASGAGLGLPLSSRGRRSVDQGCTEAGAGSRTSRPRPGAPHVDAPHMTAPAAATGMRKLSIDQMLRLMQLEVDKAQAHGYPISCMLMSLDGHDAPEDEPFRKRVMPAVFHLLKRVTFARSVKGLGFWSEKVVLA